MAPRERSECPECGGIEAGAFGQTLDDFGELVIAERLRRHGADEADSRSVAITNNAQVSRKAFYGAHTAHTAAD